MGKAETCGGPSLPPAATSHLPFQGSHKSKQANLSIQTVAHSESQMEREESLFYKDTFWNSTLSCWNQIVGIKRWILTMDSNNVPLLSSLAQTGALPRSQGRGRVFLKSLRSTAGLLRDSRPASYLSICPAVRQEPHSTPVSSSLCLAVAFWAQREVLLILFLPEENNNLYLQRKKC